MRNSLKTIFVLKKSKKESKRKKISKLLASKYGEQVNVCFFDKETSLLDLLQYHPCAVILDLKKGHVLKQTEDLTYMDTRENIMAA